MSITEASHRRREAGMTLVEILMSLGVGVILMAVVISFSIYQGRSFAVLTNMVDMDQANRETLDRLSRDVRQVNRVTTYGTNRVILEDYDLLPLTYTYDATAGTLTRTKSGQSTVLLRGCDSLQFTMMQRNIVAGSFAYYPADDESTCKVLGVTWVCSRTILGRKTNITGTQSARIVIRKQ
jgi:Tfp pilus assembly protein PilW